MVATIHKGLIANDTGEEFSNFSARNDGQVKINGYVLGGASTKLSWSLSAATEQDILYPAGSTLIISSATYWPKNQSELDANFFPLTDEADLTASTIAFNDNGASPDTITDSGSGFLAAGFSDDRPIIVSGSTSNNTNNNKEKGNLTSNTIAFVSGSPDTITDSNNDFLNHEFIAGSSCVISGSPANSGLHRIVSVTAGTLTLDTNVALTNESAGTIITIISVHIYKARTVTAGTITLDASDSLKAESAAASVTMAISTKNKFRENDINYQHNAFRILADYSRSSASATEEIVMKLRNPFSDFKQFRSVVIPKGILEGSIAFELNTIADDISIYNGYAIAVEATQAMDLTIDSITRFSTARSEIVPIDF